MPSIAKKRLFRKKIEKLFMSALPKLKLAQSSGSRFGKRTEKTKKTEFQLELIKIVDHFLDGHSNYDKNLVSFKIKDKIFITNKIFCYSFLA